MLFNTNDLVNAAEVALAAVVAPSGSVIVEKHTKKELSASATFEYYENKCSKVELFVTANKGLNEQLDSESPFAMINVVIYNNDICNNKPMQQIYGSSLISSSEFVPDQDGKTAKLTVMLPVRDNVSGNAFLITIDLRWMSTSPYRADYTKYLNQEGENIYLSVNNDRHTDATAIGSIYGNYVGYNMLTSSRAGIDDLNSCEIILKK